MLTQTDEPTDTTMDSDATARALAIYAHEDLNVLPSWHLYPSVRLEVIQSQMQIVGGMTNQPLCVKPFCRVLEPWCRSTIGLISLREFIGVLSGCTWTTRGH